MKLAALMPVRNEDWVLGLSARVALLWCDQLILLDHASTDRTASIIDELCLERPGRIVSLRNDDPTWHEMSHRQFLLETARSGGATHIAMIDADEILTSNLIPTIRRDVERLPRGAILELPGYNLRGSTHYYHATGIWADRWFSVAFAEDRRLCWSGDRFHHRTPMGAALNPWHPVAQGAGGVMHLWGVNERRLVAKHCAYKMIERLRWPQKPLPDINRLYAQAFDPSVNRQFDQHWRFAPVPDSWWQLYTPLLAHLQPDGAPWQENMCRDLYAQYGPDRFAGLDLFGVCEGVLA